MGKVEDPEAATALLRSLASSRGVEVFAVRTNKHGDLVFGLRKGSAFGEFDVSYMTIFGSLSNGFDIGAGEVELEEMLWSAVEFVARLDAGALRVTRQRGLFKWHEVLEGDDLLYARRAERLHWWNAGGPYEATYLRPASDH